MNDILKLSQREFVSFLLNRSRPGANGVAISVVVKVPLRKGHPFTEVFKGEEVAGQVQFCYKRNVVNQLRREGQPPTKFKPGTSWHTVVLRESGKLSPLSRHKEDGSRLYLRFRTLNAHRTRYFDIDGHDLPAEAVEPWKSRKEDYSNQGTENPIRFKVYKLSSIHCLKMDGKTILLNQVMETV